MGKNALLDAIAESYGGNSNALMHGMRNGFQYRGPQQAGMPSARQFGESLSMSGVPIVSDLASGALAAADVANGDYGSAAMNAAGLLPFVPGVALGMKTIKTEKQLADVIADGEGKYVRWSRGPSLDKKAGSSRDYLSGGAHEGYSAVPINPDWATDPEWMGRRVGEYGFLRMKDEKISPYIYSGKKVGVDSDGYDLINEIEGLYKIDPSLIDGIKSRFKK